MGTLRSLDNSITSERLSEQQAADYIAVSLSTLRRWRAEGVGPAVFQFRGVIRYYRADLDAFIAANTTPFSGPGGLNGYLNKEVA
ncbi:MAG: helix-turn-helix domain-containing protein [Burkholderiales bacterium]